MIKQIGLGFLSSTNHLKVLFEYHFEMSLLIKKGEFRTDFRFFCEMGRICLKRGWTEINQTHLSVHLVEICYEDLHYDKIIFQILGLIFCSSFDKIKQFG